MTVGTMIAAVTWSLFTLCNPYLLLLMSPETRAHWLAFVRLKNDSKINTVKVMPLQSVTVNKVASAAVANRAALSQAAYDHKC